MNNLRRITTCVAMLMIVLPAAAQDAGIAAPYTLCGDYTGRATAADRVHDLTKAGDFSGQCGPISRHSQSADVVPTTSPTDAAARFAVNSEIPPSTSDRWSPVLQMAETKPAKSAQMDLAEAAQKSNNPISDIWMLITQNDTTFLTGDAIDDNSRFVNVTKFMPMLSFPVSGGDWNFVVRPVLRVLRVRF